MSTTLPPTTDGRPAGESVREESLGELVGRLTSDASALLRDEVELAKLEIKEQAARAGRAGGMFGAAGLAAWLALVLLSFAAAWGLTEVVPEGVAFVIIGLLWTVAAGALYLMARERMRDVHPKPEQTIETVQEDIQWLRRPTS
jgi:hypothetical protein